MDQTELALPVMLPLEALVVLRGHFEIWDNLEPQLRAALRDRIECMLALQTEQKLREAGL